ncbi:MAG: T9SS type A sorting domain-containing protein, partial [Lentimicrobiaceae bacterium]|nr:T9SS type A sorting domain-containing protein [Lentimicrobiaceae bacterium]
EITAFFTKKMYQITTLAGANGSISPANPLVGHGDNVTLTFTPQTGYKVNTVWVDGIENPAAAQAGAYTLLNVTQDHTVEVTFTKMQFTITATHTVGGYIVPAGVAYVEYGAHSEIYVFDSHDGYHVQAAIIDGVNNPLAIENGMYRFMDVTSNHTIHITFAADGFIIEASATEGGTINPAGAVIVPNNTDKTFYFEAYPGSELVRVLIDGINKEEAVQAGNYTFFNVTAHHTIAAQFEKKMYEVIYQPVSGALVTPVEGSSSPVAHGGTYKFVIDLEEGYSQSIIVVRVNGLVLNPFANGVYILNNIVMNQVITIEGVMLNKYEIRAQAFTGGTITPAGVLSVTHGDDKTFEIAPNPGYCIKDVVVNGVSMGATTSYTFHNVKENSTIMAHFAYGQGIDDNDEAAFKIFSHKNVVTILNEQLIPVKQAEILDIYGRLLWVGPVLIEKTEVALNVAVGIYLVRIITADNQQITTKVVIH